MAIPLHELLALPRLTSVLDIGANPIDGEPPYLRMLEHKRCTVIGFEPQADALAHLQENKGPLQTYLPHAVGDGRSHELKICHARGMSSLLEPDPDALRLFNAMPSFGEVVERRQVQTHRLDDIDLPDIDLLKVDVQGSELSILQGGRKTLQNAVFIHAEVSFLPLYKDQPVYWQVDKELREQGFVPHCLAQLRQWSIAPFLVNQDPKIGLKQLLEADVVYCRDFTRPDAMSVSQWKQLAMIAQHCYGSADLTLHALRMLVHLGALGAGVPQQFIDGLHAKQAGVSFSMGPLP